MLIPLIAVVVLAQPLVQIEQECQAQHTKAKRLDPHAFRACVYERITAASEQAKLADQEHFRKREAERLEALARENEAQALIAASEERETEALKKKCGKDFERIRRGMKFDRVRACSRIEFSFKYEDERATVYDSEGGMVRVEHGIITRLVVK